MEINAEGKVISEPCGRNTAPAILLALLDILKKEKDAIILIFPSDHVISNVEEFQNNLQSAIDLASNNYIVTFGIKPDYPETGYGYIEGAKKVKDKARAVKRFVEKPDEKKAKQYLKAGNFFWNSGMFAFKASVMLKEFRAFQPDMVKKLQKMVSEKEILLRELYHRTKNNLQVITSMLRLVKRTTANEQLESIFNKIENKILGIAIIHQKMPTFRL